MRLILQSDKKCNKKNTIPNLVMNKIYETKNVLGLKLLMLLLWTMMQKLHTLKLIFFFFDR